MTVADDVIRALRARSAGLTDAELATMLGKRHQHINQTCRTLASQGLITRGNTDRGIVSKVSEHAKPPRSPDSPAKSPTDQNWAWEGNVQSRLVTHLAANGWSITRVADTERQERGADIIAAHDGQRLLVEVKGWPSKTYARGERAGQPKPTPPATQARHWFAEALTTLIRCGDESGHLLAMCLPDMPGYRSLLGEAAWALDRLDITVYLVTADGAVRIWEREN